MKLQRAIRILITGFGQKITASTHLMDREKAILSRAEHAYIDQVAVQLEFDRIARIELDQSLRGAQWRRYIELDKRYRNPNIRKAAARNDLGVFENGHAKTAGHADRIIGPDLNADGVNPGLLGGKSIGSGIEFFIEVEFFIIKRDFLRTTRKGQGFVGGGQETSFYKSLEVIVDGLTG